MLLEAFHQCSFIIITPSTIPRTSHYTICLTHLYLLSYSNFIAYYVDQPLQVYLITHLQIPCLEVLQVPWKSIYQERISLNMTLINSFLK